MGTAGSSLATFLITKNEQVKLIGATHRLGGFQDETAACLHSNAHKPSRMRIRHSSWPDGWQVGAGFLTRLRAFHQHAALLAGKSSMASQFHRPLQKPVGSFNTFKRNRPPADSNGTLPDIEPPDRPRSLESR